MLITETGSRPNLLDVIPEQWLSFCICPLTCIFFWSQCPGKDRAEARGLGVSWGGVGQGLRAGETSDWRAK